MTIRTVVGLVATVTLTATAPTTYADARCPGCSRLVMALPNVQFVEVRTVTHGNWSGRGPVTKCRRCGYYLEVIGHR